MHWLRAKADARRLDLQSASSGMFEKSAVFWSLEAAHRACSRKRSQMFRYKVNS